MEKRAFECPTCGRVYSVPVNCSNRHPGVPTRPADHLREALDVGERVAVDAAGGGRELRS